MKLGRLASAGVVAWVCVACGGGNFTTVDMPIGDVDGGLDASTAAHDGATGTNGDATTSSPDGATPSPDGSSAIDGAPTSGGSSSDAGPGGTTLTLTCGSAQCALPLQSCCVYAGNPTSYECVTGSACPVRDAGAGNGGGNNNGQATALQCSGAANCPASTVCCVSQSQQTNRTTSSCKATCGGNEAQLCDPNAATSGCSQGVQCSSSNIADWGLPPTYATCGGKGN